MTSVWLSGVCSARQSDDHRSLVRVGHELDGQLTAGVATVQILHARIILQGVA